MRLEKMNEEWIYFNETWLRKSEIHFIRLLDFNNSVNIGCSNMYYSETYNLRIEAEKRLNELIIKLISKNETATPSLVCVQGESNVNADNNDI